MALTPRQERTGIVRIMPEEVQWQAALWGLRPEDVYRTDNCDVLTRLTLEQAQQVMQGHTQNEIESMAKGLRALAEHVENLDNVQFTTILDDSDGPIRQTSLSQILQLAESRSTEFSVQK